MATTIRDRVAPGAAVRSRTGAALPAASQADQQILARGRTYVRVQGRWCYLYRAIDSAGALSDESHPQPRVINTDLAPIGCKPSTYVPLRPTVFRVAPVVLCLAFGAGDKLVTARVPATFGNTVPGEQ
jgi:hypothetical protein